MRLLLPCLLAAAVAATGTAAEPFNGTGELGEPGQAAPGFWLRQWFLPASLPAVDGPGYRVLTADDGAGGHCLRLPGVAGRVECNLTSERFTLAADGEVELSFRLRADAAEDGSWDPEQRVVVDLRAMDPRVLQWKPVAERYPVLAAFAVQPTRAWQVHTRRIAARGGFPYELAFRCSARPPARLNTLEIDDIALRPPGATAAAGDEAAVATDRAPAVYGAGDEVVLSLRARLAGGDGAVTAQLLDDRDGSVVAQRDLALAAAAAAGGADGRRLWTGAWTLRAPRFGSFSTVLSRGGVRLRSSGGDLVVVRPPVRHAPGSPGASLGADLQGTHVPLPLTASTEPTLHTSTARPGDEIPFLRLAGIQAVRLWADWNLVEPERGRFRADVVGRELDAIAAAGMTPLLTLGATFTHAPPPDADPPKGTLPPWLYRAATVRPGTVLPPLDAWDGYVAACLRLFGDRVRCWEVVNEASNGWSADEYLPLLASVHRLVKAAQPDGLVIGNGATGDVGPRPLDWTRALAARHHERFLDAIAFHPYGAALDLQGGERFQYRDLVAGLRGLLGEPRPLWNTECFFLPSATRAQGQSWEEQSTFTAGDLQRHYLDGLWHGVVVSTAPIHDSLLKRQRGSAAGLVPNQVFAGINALSCLLAGIERLERIEVNPLVRTGLFTGAGRRDGLGFIVDLRPGGSRWQAPSEAFAGIALLDLFGNPLPPGAEPRCGTDPLYLVGEPAAIARLLRASRWTVAEPIALAGRVVGDRLHLEGINRTGLASTTTVRFPGTALPDVACRFRAAERFPAVLPGAALPAALAWTAHADGEQVGSGTLALGPPAPVLALVLGQPSRIALARGSVLAITAHPDRLAIAAEVPEAEPRQAPDDQLFAGSALEAFIDLAPGWHPDQDAVGGAVTMAVAQYIAAALPSPGGRTLWSRQHRRPALASAARTTRSRSAGGWQVGLDIPWDELVPPDGAPSVLGIDAEIDRTGPDGRPSKESWGRRPGESYRCRSHYPLVALPPEVVAAYREPARAQALFGAAFLADGGFEADGAWRIENPHPALRIADGAGFAGSRGVDIAVAPEAAAGLPGRLAVYQRLPCRSACGKLARVSFLLRLTDLRSAIAIAPDGNACGFSAYLHYRDLASGRHLNNEGLGLSVPVLGSQEWTAVAFLSRIPAEASEITLSLGLRGPVSGRVQIDEVAIAYLDP